MARSLRWTEAARSLETFAERGRQVPEAGSPTIREIYVKSYRLIYEITPEAVVLLAFVHGARDLGTLWPSRKI